MAAAILQNKHLEGIEVKSAGLFAMEGSSASPHACQVLKEQQVEFTHSARRMSEELADWADYIFTMTSSHREAVKHTFPRAANKTFSLKEFAEGARGDVADPYGGSLQAYRDTFLELNRLINRLVKKIWQNN